MLGPLVKAQLVAFLTKKVRPTPPAPLSPLALAHRGPSLSSFSRAAPSPRVSRPSTAPLVSSKREPTTRSCKQSVRRSPPCLLHRPGSADLRPTLPANRGARRQEPSSPPQSVVDRRDAPPAIRRTRQGAERRAAQVHRADEEGAREGAAGRAACGAAMSSWPSADYERGARWMSVKDRGSIGACLSIRVSSSS